MEKLVIRGKIVYIFERHNFALCAWAERKRSYSPELILITLDHHADTQPAFRRYANDGGRSKVEMEALIVERISHIDVRDEQSVFQAAADLWNNEQIDAAMKLKLFRAAFCFNQEKKASIEEDHDIEPDWRSLLEDAPDPVSSDGIFTIGEPYPIGWTGSVLYSEFERPLADQAIESVMLEQLISRANPLAGNIGIGDIRDQPFVLDIDLDYFRTMDSLAPKDPAVFHKLIKAAKAITIATEPSWVRSNRLDQELTADYALKVVLKHIDSALSA